MDIIHYIHGNTAGKKFINMLKELESLSYTNDLLLSKIKWYFYYSSVKNKQKAFICGASALYLHAVHWTDSTERATKNVHGMCDPALV